MLVSRLIEIGSQVERLPNGELNKDAMIATLKKELGDETIIEISEDGIISLSFPENENGIKSITLDVF